MKPLVQKLPIEAEQSFVARTYRTPHFEVGWHQHAEYELILFTEGSGMSFIGNHVGEFSQGDIYLLGARLPHTFQKSGDQVTGAVVVHFLEDCLGPAFFQLPELRNARALLDNSAQGLKLNADMARKLDSPIRELEKATGWRRVQLLVETLDQVARQPDYVLLSTQELKTLPDRDRDCINRVFRYTIAHFREPISLDIIAGVANLSVPAFCRYFRGRTQKTYIDFLNEVRVGYACSQLTETSKPVIDICYESGYNTIAHFHRQFLKLRGHTPLQYRKQFHSFA